MDEKKQIEEMARIICESSANKANCDKCGFHRDCSKFYDATNIYNSNYRKQEWISVDERLPTKEDANCQGDVLAITRNDGRVRTWSWDWLKYYPRSFTHWMPIPEPPKGE